jgi:ubiquinone/menaquinone biosynthesis C-methylase UbiE
MKLTTLDILACPECHGELILHDGPAGESIESGSLYCPACDKTYPIQDGLPHFVKLEELDGQNQRFAKFYDWFSVIYAPGARLTYSLFGEKGRRHILHRLDPLCGRVLETSIGSGPNLPFFIAAPQVTEIHGLDISNGQLQQCRRYARKRGWQVELTHGNAEKLPYKDNSFDAIFHFGGINFFNNMQQAVDEMVRVAKPGTKVVFADEGEKIAKAYEKTLPTFKGLFEGKRDTVRAPLHLVPPEMEDIQLTWMFRKQVYVIEFRKPGGQV